jgi:pentatricopeptide repeat protein
VLGIIQVGSQAMADRYAYLPLLPFYLLIGIGIAKIAQLNHRILKMGILVIVVILGTTLFRLTQQQQSVWKDNFTLWSQSLKYNSQDNSLAHHEIAKIYMNLGDYPRAVLHCQKSLEINPELKTYSTLANIYFKWNKPEEMLKVYEKMIQAGLEEASGEVDVIFFNIAVISFRQRNLIKAREAAEKTLKFNPEHVQAKWLLEKLNVIAQPEP